MTEKTLLNYGFERILSDHWTKDGFGVSEIKGKYYASFVGSNQINSEEDLKKMFKERTGKELMSIK